jgi:hypothetical protein
MPEYDFLTVQSTLITVTTHGSCRSLHVLSKTHKQMAIISINMVNLLIFLVEKECVFCEVGTGY